MIPPFEETIKKINAEFLQFNKLLTLQVNLGNYCNQSCEHCHLEAGPQGKGITSKEIITKIIQFLKRHRELTLDITGGSPELSPYLKLLVEKAYPLVPRIMVRTNLTVLTYPGMEWAFEWYSKHRVVLIASLPCYMKGNVDAQRGNGVFERSIEALKKLNQWGFGHSLELNLVHNPLSASLPGSHEQLEREYKQQLYTHHQIIFNKLFIITNAPLGRFAQKLKLHGNYEPYLSLLADNFNSAIAGRIMCRTLINVDRKGTLFDCDFNQAAGLPIRNGAGEILTLDTIEEAITKGRKIVTGNHCYSCTAGEGSSCTGKLAE